MTAALMIVHIPGLACPACRAAVAPTAEGLRCISCRRSYEVVAGIPDLRLSRPDPDEDFDRARELADRFQELDVAGLVREHRRLGGIDSVAAPFPYMEAIERARGAALGQSDRFLGVGCGVAGLAAVVPRRAGHVVASDISMSRLLLARKWLQEAGIESVQLLCCEPEAPPFRAGSFDVVCVRDAMGHTEREAMVTGCNRILTPRGLLFLAPEHAPSGPALGPSLIGRPRARPNLGRALSRRTRAAGLLFLALVVAPQAGAAFWTEAWKPALERRSRELGERDRELRATAEPLPGRKRIAAPGAFTRPRRARAFLNVPAGLALASYRVVPARLGRRSPARVRAAELGVVVCPVGSRGRCSPRTRRSVSFRLHHVLARERRPGPDSFDFVFAPPVSVSMARVAFIYRVTPGVERSSALVLGESGEGPTLRENVVAYLAGFRRSALARIVDRRTDDRGLSWGNVAGVRFTRRRVDLLSAYGGDTPGSRARSVDRAVEKADSLVRLTGYRQLRGAAARLVP